MMKWIIAIAILIGAYKVLNHTQCSVQRMDYCIRYRDSVDYCYWGVRETYVWGRRVASRGGWFHTKEDAYRVVREGEERRDL